MLLPVHVVFLELIIDPACSIAFEAEPEEANVMNRPPRDPQRPLFDRRTLLLSLLQGRAFWSSRWLFLLSPICEVSRRPTHAR